MIINILNYNKILNIVIQIFFYHLLKNDTTKIVVFVFDKMYNLNIFSKTCSFETIFNFTILFEKIDWIAYFEYNFESNKCQIIYLKKWCNCDVIAELLFFKHNFKKNKKIRTIKRNKSHESNVLKIFNIKSTIENSINLKKKTINIIFDI